MNSRVSERGQITIDRAAREQLGVQPGMVAYQRVIDDHLEIVFLPAPHRRSLYGVFRQHADAKNAQPSRGPEDDVMDAVAEEQVERARDDADRA